MEQDTRKEKLLSFEKGHKVTVKTIQVSSYLSPSQLPGIDRVINPYVGCPHKCMYCYAEFMKRFSRRHGNEVWGDFLDVKLCDQALTVKDGETILLGSVTDPYNPYEAQYKLTRKILEQIVKRELFQAKYQILTKSSLILRDLDLLKQIKQLRVGISMNTLDDHFRKQIEPYSSNVSKRIGALRVLKENGIDTYLFMSPIFPGITDFESLVDVVQPFVNVVCFENLNLRSAFKPRILNFVGEQYPLLTQLFEEIYVKKKNDYWEGVLRKINTVCTKRGLRYETYFYHPTKQND